MAGTYTELYYHLIWATKNREPLVTPALQGELYGHIRGKCAELRVFVHALNGIEDHVHLVCSIPPAIALSEFIRRIKGASSHFSNKLQGTEGDFWQPGYGALTVSRRDLPVVVAYVLKQQEHHRLGTLHEKMERLTED